MPSSSGDTEEARFHPDHSLFLPLIPTMIAATVLPAAVSSFSPLCCCSQRRSALLSSSPHTLDLRNPRSYLYASVSQLGLGLDSPWSGLKHLGISSRQIYGQKKKKEKGKVVYASLFGVGAPEALVIGVVALLVFGPKGLAEVARNLGKTLRAFQPTIRELQEVSREFKSTLEREIGLDEVATSISNTSRSTTFANEQQQAVVDPNGTPKTESYTSDELLKITKEQLAASATISQTESLNTEEPPKEESTSSETLSTPVVASSPETPVQTASSTTETER